MGGLAGGAQVVGIDVGVAKQRLYEQANAGARGDHAVAMQKGIIGHGPGDKALHTQFITCRFKAHHAAGRGRHSDGTAAIAGVRRAQQPPRDLYRRTARGTTRSAAGIEGIIGMGQAYWFRIYAQTQLRGGGFTDDARTLLLQGFNKGIAALGVVGAIDISQGSRHAADIAEILSGEDPAGQPASAGGLAVYIQVGETVFLGAKAVQIRAELFYGKVHGAPV